MPVRLATDPDFQGRGIFRELEAANEERARDLGIRLLLIVPNAASARILVGALGWAKLPPVRLWSRLLPRRPAADGGAGRPVRRLAAGEDGRGRPRPPRRDVAQLALRRLAEALHAPRRRWVRRRRQPRARRDARCRRRRPPRATQPRWPRGARSSPRRPRGSAAATCERATCRPIERSPCSASRSTPPCRCPSALISSSGTSTSCEANRLRDPGGRSRRPDPRRRRREDARAGRARRRGRRPRAPGRARRRCRRTAASVSSAARRRAPRGRLYASALRRELSPKPLAVVAHSVPLYAILAAPLTKPARVPLLLWFTHWKPSRTLVLAERLSTAILSVDRRSFPLDSGKVVAIGHGIDTDRFACAEREPGPLRAVALGRTSPAKGLETIARAAGLAGVELDVYGPSATDEERVERQRLLDLGVRLHDPVPYARRPGAARLARGAREQHARGLPRQDRLRGGFDVHARARVEHGVRRRPSARASLPARRSRRPGGAAAYP